MFFHRSKFNWDTDLRSWLRKTNALYLFPEQHLKMENQCSFSLDGNKHSKHDDSLPENLFLFNFNLQNVGHSSGGNRQVYPNNRNLNKEHKTYWSIVKHIAHWAISWFTDSAILFWPDLFICLFIFVWWRGLVMGQSHLSHHINVSKFHWLVLFDCENRIWLYFVNWSVSKNVMWTHHDYLPICHRGRCFSTLIRIVFLKEDRVSRSLG